MKKNLVGVYIAGYAMKKRISSLITENQIREAFDAKTFRKGKIYQEEGRVQAVYRVKDRLFGIVWGNEQYHGNIDESSLQNSCSCPLKGNCKHVVAILLEATDIRQIVDGNILLRHLHTLKKTELIQLIQEHIEEHPESLLSISLLLRNRNIPRKEKENQVININVQNLHKSTITLLQEFETQQKHPLVWLRQLIRFIRINQNIFTAEIIYKILKFLISDLDYLIDLFDYESEDNELYEVFETLADTWARTRLTKEDFKTLETLWLEDGYDFSSTFYSRLIVSTNAPFLTEFTDLLQIHLTSYEYLEFLINSNQSEQALEEIMENRIMLSNAKKFEFLLSINPQIALGFAEEKYLDDSLINYYFKSQSIDPIIAIFNEVVESKTRSRKISQHLITLQHIHQIISDYSELSTNEQNDMRKKLWHLAHLGHHRCLKARLAIELNDEQLLLKMLPIPKSLWETDFDLGNKVLQILEKKYPQKVAANYYKLFDWTITSEVLTHREALIAISKLKTLQPREKWTTHIKTAYDKSYRKNIWMNLRYHGVNIRKKKGKVELSFDRD